jgi:hypothetical protein
VGRQSHHRPAAARGRGRGGTFCAPGNVDCVRVISSAPARSSVLVPHASRTVHGAVSTSKHNRSTVQDGCAPKRRLREGEGAASLDTRLERAYERAVAVGCGQNGYLSSRSERQNRWHSLVKCDRGDSTTSRFDSPPPQLWREKVWLLKPGWLVAMPCCTAVRV